MKKLLKQIFYSLIILLLIFFLYEMLCRIFDNETLKVDERNTVYQYDDMLGWIGKPNLDSYYKDIPVINNSLGFRDIEHGYKEKNKKRIMFVGDSFCWGYGVTQNKIFSELLRDKLTSYELFNCGISGYSTDQEYILLKEYFNIIKPDVVFLMVCLENDILESQQNIVYSDYYKPYFILDGNNLILKGVPVPKTWLYYKNNFFIKHSKFISSLLRAFISIKHPFVCTNNNTIAMDIILAMKSFLKEKDNIFIVGLIGTNKEVEEKCLNNNIKYINLENDNLIENDMHWNETGHQYVADKIYKFFEEENIIK